MQKTPLILPTSEYVDAIILLVGRGLCSDWHVIDNYCRISRLGTGQHMELANLVLHQLAG